MIVDSPAEVDVDSGSEICPPTPDVSVTENVGAVGRKIVANEVSSVFG